MTVENERVIELSKTKLALMIAGSLLFVAAGVWFIVAPDEGSFIAGLGRFADPWVFHGLGIVTVLFGAAGVGFGVLKSRDRTPGLTLSSAGLLDNSSAVAAGFIPWSEVTGLDLFQMGGQRMLVIKVADAGKYIERGSAVKRALNRANAGMCGSPIVISSNALRIPFDELRREVAAYVSRYAEQAGGSTPAARP